jgi:hypothetical protein
VRLSTAHTGGYRLHTRFEVLRGVTSRIDVTSSKPNGLPDVQAAAGLSASLVHQARWSASISRAGRAWTKWSGISRHSRSRRDPPACRKVSQLACAPAAGFSTQHPHVTPGKLKTCPHGETARIVPNTTGTQFISRSVAGVTGRTWPSGIARSGPDDQASARPCR